MWNEFETPTGREFFADEDAVRPTHDGKLFMRLEPDVAGARLVGEAADGTLFDFGLVVRDGLCEKTATVVAWMTGAAWED